jgi:hypothetical protein
MHFSPLANIHRAENTDTEGDYLMKTITMAALLALTALATPALRADDHAPCCPACKQEKSAKPEMMNRFGGPVFSGAPALMATAALVEAGGGPENFSIAKALTTIGGQELIQAEVAKLTKQYGEEKVKSWIMVFDYAVKEALNIATEAGVKLPKSKLSGKKLAAALVTAGLDKSGTFWTCTMLDKAVSHKIHEAAMDKIDAKFGTEANTNYHAITNQAMYDLAQALGMKKVKLAGLH